MKHPLLILSVFFSLLFPAGVSAADPSSSATAPADANAAATSTPESALKPGMPAASVRRTMGQPVEITPMKAPDGKAEIWVYRRNLNVRITRVQTGSVPITVTTIGSDGKAHEQTIGETPQYGDLYQATEETIQLLMFNDQYVTQKTSHREIQHYNN